MNVRPLLGDFTDTPVTSPLRERPQPGERICVVEMRGCMAEVRHNPQYGTVYRSYVKRLYPTNNDVHHVDVRMDDGTTETLVVTPANWVLYNGVPEYRG